MCRIPKEVLHSDEGEKVICFRRNFMAHFRELPEDEGGISYMGSTLDASGLV